MKNWNKSVFLTAVCVTLLGTVPAFAQEWGTKASYTEASPQAAAVAQPSPEVYVTKEKVGETPIASRDVYLMNGPINLNGGGYIGAESAEGTKAQSAIAKVYMDEPPVLVQDKIDTSPQAYNTAQAKQAVVEVREINSPHPQWFGKAVALPVDLATLVPQTNGTKADKQLPPAAASPN